MYPTSTVNTSRRFNTESERLTRLDDEAGRERDNDVLMAAFLAVAMDRPSYQTPIFG